MGQLQGRRVGWVEEAAAAVCRQPSPPLETGAACARLLSLTRSDAPCLGELGTRDGPTPGFGCQHREKTHTKSLPPHFASPPKTNSGPCETRRACSESYRTHMSAASWIFSGLPEAWAAKIRRGGSWATATHAARSRAGRMVLGCSDGVLCLACTPVPDFTANGMRAVPARSTPSPWPCPASPSTPCSASCTRTADPWAGHKRRVCRGRWVHRGTRSTCECPPLFSGVGP